MNTAPPKTAQTTLLVLGKLLGTLLIWVSLLHTTDLSTITALVAASAVATALTIYLAKTIPLILAGKKSLGEVAQDMMKMAGTLDQVKKGEIDAFKQGAETLSDSLSAASESLESPPPSSTSSSDPVAEPTLDMAPLHLSLTEAASLMEMGYGLDIASAKTGVPIEVIEKLEQSGNGEWKDIKRDAHDHMLRRISDAYRS